MINQRIRPRNVDAEVVRKAVVRTFKSEKNRRKKTVDDEFREDIAKPRKYGEFSLSNISMHDIWQEMYYDKFGGKIVPMNGEQVCRNCGTRFLMAYTPEFCPNCKKILPLGELIQGRHFNK